MMSMNYQESLEYIHSFERFGWVLGRLERIRELLCRLGNPDQKLKFIHVAGTNGKGSTSTMCANILKQAGYRCGLYTSPFVVEFRERYQVNGEMISEETFARLASMVKPVIEEMYQEQITITEFEVITVIAFLYFAEQSCDFVCLETGMGGDDDATNVIDPPLISAITSISLDHVAILGDTIEEIAGHKAGIIKEKSICVCYPKQHLDAVSVLMKRCAETNSTFVLPNGEQVTIEQADWQGTRFRYGEDAYSLKLIGEHQPYNAVTAIEVMSALRTKGYAVPQTAVQDGLAETVLPARFQILSEHPRVIADGSHNPEACISLEQTLSSLPGKKVMILGMLADKDYEESLRHLCTHADAVICVPVDNPRALGYQALYESAKQFCADSLAEQDLASAYQKALALAGHDGNVIITGSFYLAGSMIADVIKKQ